MYRFWDSIIRPIFKSLLPKSIVEIGADQGNNTKNLLDFCIRYDAILYTIDPLPKFDVAAWREQYGECFTFFQALSLNAICQIENFDAVLIDGDHNWYTVFNELKLIEKRSQELGQPFPLVMLHDVGWPYGRRDLYYNPENIPAVYRKPYAKKGIRFGSPELVDDGGINPHLFNAIYENNLQNGVLAAVEDFIKETDQYFEFVNIPGQHGLGVLLPAQLKECNQELTEYIYAFTLPVVAKHIERIEASRVDAEMKMLEWQDRLSKSDQELVDLREHVTGIKSELHKERMAFCEERERLKAEVSELRHNIFDKDHALAEKDRQLSEFKDKVNRQTQDIEMITAWIEQMKAGFAMLLDTHRWKMGNALGELQRKMLFKRRQPMVTDCIDSMYQDFQKWKQENKDQKLVSLTGNNTAINESGSISEQIASFTQAVAKGDGIITEHKKKHTSVPSGGWILHLTDVKIRPWLSLIARSIYYRAPLPSVVKIWIKEGVFRLASPVFQRSYRNWEKQPRLKDTERNQVKKGADNITKVAAPRLAYRDLLARALFKPEMHVPYDQQDDYFISFMNSYARYLEHRYNNQPQSELVSIVMPTFNRMHCIGDAIKSVIAQTYKNWELIIVDDCSSDDTAAVVSLFADPRIKYLRLEKNLGCAGARNAALDRISGDFVTYLDSDNTIEPSFLLILVNVLKENANFDMVFCAQRAFRISNGKQQEIFVRFAPFHRPSLENGNYIDLGVIMHRRSLIERFGKFNVQMLRLSDWESLLRFSVEKSPKAVPAILSKYYYGKANNQNTTVYSFDAGQAWIDACVRTDPISKEVPDLSLSGMEQMFSLPYKVPEPVMRRPVSIIIPSFEAKPYLCACVEAIYAFSNEYDFELIIVDNASGPSVTNYLNELEEQGRAKVLRNESNFGFTFAVNQGIQAASAQNDVIILNNDAIVTRGWLSALQAVICDYPDVGLVVPGQVLLGGEKTLPIHRPDRNPYRECDVNLSAHHANVLEPLFDEAKGYVELAYAPFFCVYVPRATLDRVGVLDVVNGPHYRSDRLYCDIVREIGRRILYTPHSKVYHFVQRATYELKSKDNIGYKQMFIDNDWAAISEHASRQRHPGVLASETELHRHAALIRESGLFDQDYYLAQNADVAAAGCDPVLHYLKQGASEGLDPNSIFDSDWYLMRYPDVSRENINPLVHYIRFGAKEGCDPHPLFDSDWYLSKNPDVDAAGMNPLAHYLCCGAWEKCEPHFEFDTYWYLAQNPDVAATGMNPLAHYVRYGIKQGYRPHPEFDVSKYMHGVSNHDSTLRSDFDCFGVAEYGPIAKVLQYCAHISEPKLTGETICVQLHLFHTDLAEHFANVVNRLNKQHTLLISVQEGENASVWQRFFTDKVKNAEQIIVKNVPNRGRDVLPWQVSFADEIQKHTILCHLHTKKSKHNQAHYYWRDFLEHTMFGSQSLIDQILACFDEEPSLGLVYPAYYGTLRNQPHWQGNRELFTRLYRRMTGHSPPEKCPDFPAGSFFWIRTSALKPLFDLKLDMKDFQFETGQTDGTLAHAVERIIGVLPDITAMKKMCVAVDVSHHLVTLGASRSEQMRSAARLLCPL